MELSIAAGGHTTTHPPFATREIILGETLAVHPAGAVAETIDVTEEPDGEPCEVDGEHVTPHEVGRHCLRVTSRTGAVATVNLLVVEPEAFEALPHGQETGSGQKDRRAILRSLANYAAWFNGRRSDLVNQTLTPYGG